ncbi:Alanine aminotransferase 2 [Diplonema papillatum]|nr:Alanine aminotransferase 2 [Diplonema papillatum]
MKRTMTLLRQQFTLDTMNKGCVAAQYAVRGPIVTRSQEIEDDLKRDPSSHPFPDVIACNIGNPQALLQKPITFYRQVSALINDPWLLQNPDIVPTDVAARANSMLAHIGHANKTGAYTHSQGYQWIRNNIAKALERRDGVPAHAGNIFLTDGASPGIKLLIQLLCATPEDAIMIPTPQYPLYSATIALVGAQPAPYLLNEENDWALSVEELEQGYKAAVDAGKNVRAIVVINPGNPTGQVMSRQNVAEVVAWAAEKGIMILADEVYQENTYAKGSEFVSFKSIVAAKYPEQPLASFHSISKGVIGECGKRGGYMELHGIDPGVHDCIYKLSSISLCPNVNGQILTDLMMTPPAKGDESYEDFIKETTGLKASLARRAEALEKGLNSIPSISTRPIAGAMYAFPSLALPEAFVEECRAKGVEPDFEWCMRLLEATGIVVVPGSGFGQKPGTYHFRTTILPPEDMIDQIIERLTKFQASFLGRY